jgi:hypothetical protein
LEGHVNLKWELFPENCLEFQPAREDLSELVYDRFGFVAFFLYIPRAGDKDSNGLLGHEANLRSWLALHHREALRTIYRDNIISEKPSGLTTLGCGY